jgi:hypothetical protein
MRYLSTRDKSISLTGAEAIARGLSRDGGLFVPESFPAISREELTRLVALPYRERAVAIIHPDICSAGGILEMKRIGDMAEKYHVSMIAHMCETPVAALATAHMGVATENFIACEFMAADVPWWNDMITGFGGPVIKDGFITPNEKPGLGFDDLNDGLLKEHLMPGTGGVWDDTSFWDKIYSNDKKFS